jgi:hypothetical protein
MMGRWMSSTCCQPHRTINVPKVAASARLVRCRPALARPRGRRVEWQAIEQHEDQQRQQRVGDEGMTRQAVEPAAPTRPRMRASADGTARHCEMSVYDIP